MYEIIEFGNEIYLNREQIDKVVDAVISVIKKELPEEALCVNVINSILEETKSRVKCKRVNL